MPTQDGEYYRLTKEDIQENFEDNLERKLNKTAQPGTLVKKSLEAEAETLAENHEKALERIYYAGYLQDATGKELDKVVDVIGLDRFDANPSSGTVKLMRETPPTTSYTVPAGTTVQTKGQNPIRFVTTELTELPYIDGWETNDLSNWVGDTSSFSVVSTTNMTGNYALKVPATSGVQIEVDGGSYGIGTTFNADIRPVSGSITEFRFAYQDSSNYHKAVIDTSVGELRLETVEGGSSVGSSLSSVSIPTGATSHIEVEWSLYGDNGLRLYQSDSKDTLIGSVYLDQTPLWSSGNVAIRSADGTATCLVDEYSGTEVTANIEAEENGTVGNVGPNQISVLGNSVAGVEDVTNEVATGDTSYQDTDLNTFKTGQDKETDEELRERAFDNTSIGGAATINALKTEIQRVDGFQSLTVYQNKTESTVDGLPPHSFELVVHGGSDEDIGKKMFKTSSVDSQDIGGVHGTEATYDVSSDVTDGTVTMHWSRPTEVNLEIGLDLIVDDSYVGDEEIKDICANYIGGTDIYGSFTEGLDVGEDVYEAILKNRITDPDETGVWEVNSLTLDSNGDGTDDTTTTASGADVLTIAKNEVAQTNARDGSISITTSTK